jgi:hypothetical protein
LMRTWWRSSSTGLGLQDLDRINRIIQRQTFGKRRIWIATQIFHGVD